MNKGNDKVLNYFMYSTILLMLIYVLISSIIFFKGVNEAVDNNRDYEISFVRKLEDHGVFIMSENRVVQLKSYTQFIKIYYNDDDKQEMINDIFDETGELTESSELPNYYYPSYFNEVQTFYLIFAIWMVHAVLTGVHVIGKHMFIHSIIIEVIMILIWVTAGDGDEIFLSLRGFLLFLPLMLANIWVIRNTRFKEYKENWFTGIFTFKEVNKLY